MQALSAAARAAPVLLSRSLKRWRIFDTAVTSARIGFASKAEKRREDPNLQLHNAAACIWIKLLLAAREQQAGVEEHKM